MLGLTLRLPYMKYFAATYTYGEQSLVDDTRPAHREFIASQLSLGRIVGSGPLAGAEQALIILQLPDTATEADAAAVVE